MKKIEIVLQTKKHVIVALCPSLTEFDSVVGERAAMCVDVAYTSTSYDNHTNATSMSEICEIHVVGTSLFFLSIMDVNLLSSNIKSGARTPRIDIMPTSNEAE